MQGTILTVGRLTLQRALLPADGQITKLARLCLTQRQLDAMNTLPAGGEAATPSGGHHAIFRLFFGGGVDGCHRGECQECRSHHQARGPAEEEKHGNLATYATKRPGP
ncbi:hypothetical protein GCM10011317_48640 [Niveispirillum cyanobacteriorum]|nr:hypothetical protein GCM10011317_48640 [Niveispirillum cyanobacteriorum]